jgi:hypothetical protein
MQHVNPVASLWGSEFLLVERSASSQVVMGLKGGIKQLGVLHLLVIVPPLLPLT